MSGQRSPLLTYLVGVKELSKQRTFVEDAADGLQRDHLRLVAGTLLQHDAEAGVLGSPHDERQLAVRFGLLGSEVRSVRLDGVQRQMLKRADGASADPRSRPGSRSSPRSVAGRGCPDS